MVVSPVDPNAVAKPDYPQTQVVRRIRYRDDGDGWRGDAFSQLFIIALDGAEKRQLTRQDKMSDTVISGSNRKDL